MLILSSQILSIVLQSYTVVEQLYLLYNIIVVMGLALGPDPQFY